MSGIATTEAVVLRTVKFQESSTIVTFYTERFGRLAGIVKGARKSPGRFGASLQPMAQVSVVVYRKPGRDVQTVSHCDLVTARRRIPLDLERMAIGLQMVELVTMVTHDEEENRELYALLAGSLLELDAETSPGWMLFYHFQLRLAGILGFAPDFSRCGGCGKPVPAGSADGGMFRVDVERGAPLCRNCDSAERRCVLIQAGELRLLDLLVRRLPAAPEGDATSGERIEKFLFDFFSYHLPGFRKFRSGEVFRRVGEDAPQ